MFRAEVSSATWTFFWCHQVWVHGCNLTKISYILIQTWLRPVLNIAVVLRCENNTPDYCRRKSFHSPVTCFTCCRRRLKLVDSIRWRKRRQEKLCSCRFQRTREFRLVAGTDSEYRCATSPVAGRVSGFIPLAPPAFRPRYTSR